MKLNLKKCDETPTFRVKEYKVLLMWLFWWPRLKEKWIVIIMFCPYKYNYFPEKHIWMATVLL